MKDFSSEKTYLYEAATAHRYLMDSAYAGNTRAAGEPASVADGKPARDSAGRCDPVE